MQYKILQDKISVDPGKVEKDRQKGRYHPNQKKSHKRIKGFWALPRV